MDCLCQHSVKRIKVEETYEEVLITTFSEFFKFYLPYGKIWANTRKKNQWTDQWASSNEKKRKRKLLNQMTHKQVQKIAPDLSHFKITQLNSNYFKLHQQYKNIYLERGKINTISDLRFERKFKDDNFGWGANKQLKVNIRYKDKGIETLRLREKCKVIKKQSSTRLKNAMNMRRKMWVPRWPNNWRSGWKKSNAEDGEVVEANNFFRDLQDYTIIAKPIFYLGQ